MTARQYWSELRSWRSIASIAAVIIFAALAVHYGWPAWYEIVFALLAYSTGVAVESGWKALRKPK